MDSENRRGKKKKHLDSIALKHRKIQYEISYILTVIAERDPKFKIK